MHFGNKNTKHDYQVFENLLSKVNEDRGLWSCYQEQAEIS